MMEMPVDVEGFRATMKEAGIEEIVDVTLAVFTRESPVTFENIRRGVEDGDLEAVHNGAHSLKSASANIWAAELARSLEALERIAVAGSVEDVRRAFEPTKKLFQDVMDFLQEEST